MTTIIYTDETGTRHTVEAADRVSGRAIAADVDAALGTLITVRTERADGSMVFDRYKATLSTPKPF